jgi:uncharacterized protein (TIGR02118 family)
MIKVSVLYPNGKGSRFDMGYYCSKHIPMVQRLLGSALKGVAVDQGVADGTPGAPPAYLAIGHLLFDSVAVFQSSFGPNAPTIVGDVPNYTNTQPIIQISEVKL